MAIFPDSSKQTLDPAPDMMPNDEMDWYRRYDLTIFYPIFIPFFLGNLFYFLFFLGNFGMFKVFEFSGRACLGDERVVSEFELVYFMDPADSRT